MTSRKTKYRTIARLAWASIKVLDNGGYPDYDDNKGWELYAKVETAVREYANYMYAAKFNPVIQEADDRGDYSVFAEQLRHHIPDRLRKKDVNKALPYIERRAEGMVEDESS